jgi:hypothetical protein
MEICRGATVERLIARSSREVPPTPLARNKIIDQEILWLQAMLPVDVASAVRWAIPPQMIFAAQQAVRQLKHFVQMLQQQAQDLSLQFQ